MSLVERIDISQRPMLLGYSIPSFGKPIDLLIPNYQGRMNFEATGPQKTRLTWVGYFDCKGLQRITAPLMRVALTRMIAGTANNLKLYLAETRAAEV